MKVLAAALFLLVMTSEAWAANRAAISRAEFAKALKAADPARLDHVDRSKLSVRSIRLLGCIGPDEEPTEFQCSWLQRTAHGWKRRETWLAIDGKGWRVMD
jgi:hypothetical protein